MPVSGWELNFGMRHGSGFTVLEATSPSSERRLDCTSSAGSDTEAR